MTGRFYLGVLLLLALAVRGAVPVGFMPGASNSGKVRMVICNGMGPSTIIVDADKSPMAAKMSMSDPMPMPSGHHHDDSASHNCPFAPVLAQTTPTFAAMIVPPPVFGRPLFAVMAETTLPDIGGKPYQSQGPPVVLTHI